MRFIRKTLAVRVRAALLTALFVLGVWLTPVLHKMHCSEGQETASAAAAGCSHDSCAADPQGEQDRPSPPARPAADSGQCLPCHLAKTSIQEASPALEVAPVSFRCIGSPPPPEAPALEPVALLPRSRAPPA